MRRWLRNAELRETPTALMIAERAAVGSKQLGYSSKNTTDDISEAFLDQPQWVSYLCPSGRVLVGDFVRQLGYKDSIECLTCDLRILMPVADRLSTGARKRDPKVKRCRSAEDEVMFCSCGEQAHPAVVAQQVEILRKQEGCD